MTKKTKIGVSNMGVTFTKVSKIYIVRTGRMGNMESMRGVSQNKQHFLGL